MSIVSSELIGVSSTKTAEKQTVTEEWLVISTSTNPTDVTDLWLIYYPGYTTAYVADVTARLQLSDTLANGNYKFVATVNYDTSVTPPEDESDDPLDIDPIYSYETLDGEQICDITIDDPPKQITNAVGDRFDPPIIIDVSRPVLVARKNVENATINFAYMNALNNSVNSDTFHGADPGTLRCKATASEAKKNDGTKYFTVDYRFIYKPEGWQPRVPNLGMRGIDGDRWFGVAHILDASNNPITTPVALGLDGEPLPDGFDPEDVPILDFNVYPEVAFSGTGV